MDTFVDSSWYFLRYTSPNYDDGPFDPEALGQWNPVDQYTGGVEHAVMHLLYARFFVKALRDLGYLDFDEPFTRLVNQGTIVFNSQKMSKSRGNVIAPDAYVTDVGTDAVRTYMMFMGPWEAGGEWNDDGINGMARWTNRVWDLANRDAGALDESDAAPDAVRGLQRALHQTIGKVSDDIERFKFNTRHSRHDGILQHPKSGVGRRPRGLRDVERIRQDARAAHVADYPLLGRRDLGTQRRRIQRPPAALGRLGTPA